MTSTPFRRLRQQDVAWRSVDDRVVVLDLRTSEYLQVNEAGSLLFERLAEGASRSELAAVLREAYDLEDDRAARDVEAFLSVLDARGLLEPVDASS